MGLQEVARGGGARSFALLPAAFALSYFLDRFATAESRLGREREIAADALTYILVKPRFSIRVRAQRFLPDMFYVNEFAERLKLHDAQVFEQLFR
ncbi:MAG: hypothetical protein ABSD31_14930 [Candidatus Binataceae bacterium]|jgi:hypothetical protein